MKITREYLKGLNMEKLNELYEKYYAMGFNIFKYDVDQGFAVLDLVDMIEIEIKCRNNNEVVMDSTKIKVKK